ncbi:MAG TPA: sugar transferase [Vitreimonas sp.]|jgi:exopolysaccharide production protein ExoY|nr:sugar transferase [Vitreimonas sp.]
MLIQMPRGSSSGQQSQSSQEAEGFEAALRRDLASAPVVSYDALLGGWQKRCVDFLLTVIAAPLWLLAIAGAALWSKVRHGAPVFLASERIGYGGRVFRCYSLRIAPPTAVVTRLHSEAEPSAPDLAAIASNAEDGRAKWRHAFERLPQFINVLRGDMSLVGPLPLSREQLDPLKTAKRYYLSARPGIVGINAIADADEEDAGQYKLYALSWSLSTDALIVWDSLRNIKDRGELWRPSAHTKRAQRAEPVIVRRRTGADAA